MQKDGNIIHASQVNKQQFERKIYTMSTYTDCHIRVRENLTLQRFPGNPCDGITQQRAIFANPENQYYGTFIGELTATGGALLSNAMIINAQIDGADISCNLLDMQHGEIMNAVIIQPVIEIDVDGHPVDLSQFLSLLSSEISALKEKTAKCKCGEDSSGDGSDEDDEGKEDGGKTGICD